MGLPVGHFSFAYGDQRYYGYHGSYYMRTPEGYRIIRPPIGAIIPRLPPGCMRYSSSFGTYYMYDDIYYYETVDGYRIVDPPVGIVTQAELGSREFQSFWLGDKEYLYRDGQFFVRIPGGLVWVEPPEGALTEVLPPGCISIWYQDIEYFELQKIYFKSTPDGYMVVSAPWEEGEAPPAN